MHQSNLDGISPSVLQKHVRQVSDSKAYQQVMFTFLLTFRHQIYSFRKTNNNSKNRDLVVQVHILLRTFIILQNVLRILIFVLK